MRSSRCWFQSISGAVLICYVRMLERQLDKEKKRSAQLNEINDLNKVTLGS